MELSLSDIRKVVDSLKNCTPVYKPLPEGWDWEVTLSGVVLGPHGSWLNLQTFKDIVDEDTYNRVVAKPRVRHEYDSPEDSVSEQSQDELEPLPEKNIHVVWGGTVDSNDVLGVLDGSYSVKWDGGDIGEVLKHGRE